MLVVYETIDDFVKKLDTLPKENTEMFISKVKDASEAGMVSAVIVVQASTKDDCFMVNFSEGVPTFQLLRSNQLFDVIPDQTLRESARKSYTDSYEAYNKKIDEEYNKMRELIVGHGFTKIENAVIQ